MELKKLIEFRIKALQLLGARGYLKLNQKSKDELKKQCPSQHLSALTRNVALIEKRGFDVLICECVESFLRDSEDAVGSLKQDRSVDLKCFKFSAPGRKR